MVSPLGTSDGFYLRTNISQRRQIKKGSPIIDKSQFESQRSQASERKSFAVSQGEKILEKKLPISHDEEVYYNSKHIFTNINKLGEDAGIETNTKMNKMPAQKSGAEIYRYQ